MKFEKIILNLQLNFHLEVFFLKMPPILYQYCQNHVKSDLSIQFSLILVSSLTKKDVHNK